MPDPSAAEHLVRHPRPDAAGQQRGREHRRAAEGESEARPEHPPGQHEEEEHGLDSGRAGVERPQRGVDRGQHAEHGEGLGVDAAVGHLGEDDREDQHEQRTEHQRRRLGGGEGAGGDDERPEERHEAEGRRQRDRDRSAGPQPDRGSLGFWPACSSCGSPVKAGGHLSHSEVGQRRKDLRNLRREGRRGREHGCGWAVGDDLSFGHHDDPVAGPGGELDIVRRHHHGVPAAASWSRTPMRLALAR